MLTGALLQVGLQLGQLHTLGGVGRREQAGRVQRHALVVAHVGLSREGVLQLQALQLLSQDRLATAQVAVGTSDLGGLCGGGAVQVGLNGGGAGNRVRDRLMGRILEDSDGGRGRRLAVCCRPIETLSLENITSINNRCRNIKVSAFFFLLLLPVSLLISLKPGVRELVTCSSTSGPAWVSLQGGSWRMNSCR